jgi:hypothetical protein
MCRFLVHFGPATRDSGRYLERRERPQEYRGFRPVSLDKLFDSDRIGEFVPAGEIGSRIYSQPRDAV